MSRECRLSALGSPPQVRGKRLAGTDRALQQGITPAGAGKTIDKDGVIVIGQDHPRRCGENRKPDMVIHPYQGSPPQVRGKHGLLVVV